MNKIEITMTLQPTGASVVRLDALRSLVPWLGTYALVN
jgi:hypothetical protein